MTVPTTPAPITVTAFLALLAPAALAVVALLAAGQPGASPRRVLAAARFASLFALVVAIAAAATVAIGGPVVSPLLGVDGYGVAVRLDALSVTMLTLVAFLGAVVLQFSRRYLDGDARHGSFMGRLALTVACVMLLVTAGNLVQLVAMWIGTSMALHRLLLFYPERVGAVIAARKKFIVARIGDVALATAAVLIVRTLGTADLGLVLERASAMAGTGTPATMHAAAALLVVAAVLKSAAFPTHGWLIEVMETPTPVSALLHAGILNGGTFLIARLAPVALLSTPALDALVVIGGLTALFASLVMITQTSVKTSLGYSSAAHMGFMLMLCGLGAYPVAILHLVAHSFYKAHAFLSSGSFVDVVRASQVPGAKGAPGAGTVLAALGVSVATVVGTGLVLGAPLTERPVTIGLSAMLAVALVQLLAQGLRGGFSAPVMARTVGAAALVTLAFFGLEAGAAHVLGGVLPAAADNATSTIALMGAVVLAFASVILLQLRLPAIVTDPRWAPLYVHVRNGLYANARFDALVGALRVPSSRPFAQEIR
jgi:NAD(P)H-quinone oxidoreductase subunit 5